MQNESSEEELVIDFEKLWKLYPKKVGKISAFKHYKSWIKGRKYMDKKIKLDNKNIQSAICKYNKECKDLNKSYKYIKDGSTFFNYAIIDYCNK